MHPKEKAILRLCIVLVLYCIFWFLVAGCATTPEQHPASQQKPSAVRLGPIMDLLEGSTGQDIVKVIPDSGRVHVLIASTTLKQVVDVIVRQDGIAKHQVILSNISPSTIDGVLDAQGRLHILIDSDHIVFEDGKGYISEPTVWQKAGITVEKPGFVRGAKELVWTCTASGEDIGATPGRWVWRGGGGAAVKGGAIIWPWHEKTRKAVIVSGSAGNNIPWNILDPYTKADSLIVDAASDALGNVHLIFATGYNVRLAGKFSFIDELSFRHVGEVTMSYACVEAKELKQLATSESDMPKGQNEVHQLHAITGTHQLDWKWTHTNLPLAVDSTTGTVLIGDHWLVKGDRLIEIVDSPPFKYHYPILIVAAGNDTFHAIAFGNIDDAFLGRNGIQYSMFSEGKWSAPLWLSTAGTLPLLSLPTVSMANIGNGNVFVAWSTEKGFVGRWIERTQ